MSMSRALPSCTVALILSGGVRDFHMTAPSIERHLIGPLGGREAACLFMRALLDPDAHKLAALLLLESPPHIGAIHVDAATVDRRLLLGSAAVMRSDQANRSAQELLQLEQAQDMVETFEAARGKAFELVVRARFDSFWHADLPTQAISTAKRVAAGGSRSGYVVPRAKQFGGVNDRLGLSSSPVARIANRRVSALLSHPAAATASQINGTFNAEQLLNWTLSQRNIPHHRVPRLPFCLLVKRKCKCCMTVEHCARSGNKCRPCTADEETAQRSNKSLELPPVWPQNAMERFDAVVSRDVAKARRSIDTRRVDEELCTRDMKALASMATLSWRSSVLPAAHVCRLAQAVDCTFDAPSGAWVGKGCADSG